MSTDGSMTQVIFPTEQEARKYYTNRAENYDQTTNFETDHHLEAIRRAAIHEGEHVLEVACGTGRASIELAKAVGPNGKLDCLDLTSAMMAKARAKIKQLGLEDRVTFTPGNARQLPYPDASFDALYNAYMFDLIPEDQFLTILAEFRRVLKPGGLLVLVNMSKSDTHRTLFEWAYNRGWAGACRPVLMNNFVNAAGFTDVQREYRKNRITLLLFPALFGAEIVIAHKS